MNQMTERLQTVIEAAERAAEAIRFDAEEQARIHLAEARLKADRLTAERVRLISELTDDLIRRAGTVRDHSEQMIGAMDEAINSVAEGPMEARPHRSTLDHTLPSRAESPPTPLPRTLDESESRQALLHATRLAVAGNDHETISRALRDEFGIASPGPIVDRVLGHS